MEEFLIQILKRSTSQPLKVLSQLKVLVNLNQLYWAPLCEGKVCIN